VFLHVIILLAYKFVALLIAHYTKAA